MNTEEKLYYSETKNSLKTKDSKIVRSRIKELKSKGSAELLPLVLELLLTESSEEIKADILELLNNLRDQSCAIVVKDFIEENLSDSQIHLVVASCWQSRLDYSEYLVSFANSFIKGNYQASIESFTIIEEAIWKSSAKNVADCKKYLQKHISDIEDDKKPLLTELINILSSGRSQNPEDFPDLYK